MNNHMEIRFSSLSENEALARMVISAFLVPMNPSLSIIAEIRTAVSEAVTNAVVHAYPNDLGEIRMRASLDHDTLMVEIEDFGCGIADVTRAMTPFYTTKPDDERTGIGFALMQSFMDKVAVTSSMGCGTIVQMRKCLSE